MLPLSVWDLLALHLLSKLALRCDMRDLHVTIELYFSAQGEILPLGTNDDGALPVGWCQGTA